MRNNIVVLTAVLMVSSMMFWGCSSSPSKDELEQLKVTQAEIASLTQKADALTSEKASLQKAIAEKQEKLKSCKDDKATVQMKLKNTQ
jgi:septal ring factor EnvC (AmiA/AmiB activator)